MYKGISIGAMILVVVVAVMTLTRAPIETPSSVERSDRYLPGQITIEDQTQKSMKQDPEPIGKLSAVNNQVNNQMVDWSPETKWFLSADNADVSQLWASGDKKRLERARKGAQELLARLVPCLANDVDCRFRPQDGASDYYNLGGPPVFQAIDRALGFFEFGASLGQLGHHQLDERLLYQAMSLPHSNVSVSAAALLFDLAKDDQARLQVLEQATQLKSKARSLFLQYAAKSKSGENLVQQPVFEKLLVDSVSPTADENLRAEIIKSMDSFGLDEMTFRRVAVASCKTARSASDRLAIGALLQRRAEAAGFQWTAKQLCQTPLATEGV